MGTGRAHLLALFLVLASFEVVRGSTSVAETTMIASPTDSSPELPTSSDVGDTVTLTLSSSAESSTSALAPMATSETTSSTAADTSAVQSSSSSQSADNDTVTFSVVMTTVATETAVQSSSSDAFTSSSSSVPREISVTTTTAVIPASSSSAAVFPTSVLTSTSSPTPSPTPTLAPTSTSGESSTVVPTSSTVVTTSPPSSSDNTAVTATVVVLVLLIAVVSAAAAVVAVVICVLKRRRKTADLRIATGWESNVEFTDSQRSTIHGEHLIQLSALSGSQQALLVGDESAPVSTPVVGRRTTALVAPRPVPIGEFAAYLEKTGNDDLRLEWAEIPQRTHDLAAQSLMNPLSNRYNNILPYDKNRVHLKDDNADGNDYINASYVDGYGVKKSYICAQGPLQRTVDDFWQTVWDHKVEIIVMLTNFTEGQKNKCAEYFALQEGKKVFVKMQLTVLTQSVKRYGDYLHRVFKIEQTKQKSSLTVQHFHFTAWPDFGVPKEPTGLLAMLERVRVTRSSHDPNKPIVVHCSAGVGRTGTYIALDQLLDQSEAEGEGCEVDVHGLVRALRDQRNLMVQAPDQYVFIHKAFRERHLLGHTPIPAHQLEGRVREMAAVNRHSGVSEFHQQYEIVKYIAGCQRGEQVSTERLKGSLRYPDRAPCQGRFINFNPLMGDDPNTFYNASFVPDYNSSKGVIVAQSPTATSTQYFWALAYELKTPLVVLLCDFQEGDEEHCARFWPEQLQGSVSYHGYQVRLLSEEGSGQHHYRMYSLSVQPEEPGLEEQKVTLFHLNSWREGESPPAHDIIHLLSAVKSFKESLATKLPTIVICNDGLGRSCLFSAIWTLSDQIDQEDQVDVVGSVKSIKIARPGALGSLDHFIQCHHLMLQYKESASLV